jgi:hypothetical protein
VNLTKDLNQNGIIFFPKSFLKKHNVDDSKINLLANIVVLNEKANKTFSSKGPADYLKINSVDKKRLEEQLIPVDDNLLKIEKL